ncbi:ATP-binding protein [Marinilactibacillus kalidii]|uniref:ATP-binding protein n=1 Tax=Marinilactibacillus kalidii TaxID=2820274 RepID=UPI001ABED4C4|nr:AAA family ATPase [Marinilactibacillus kalidii]
MKIKTLTIYGYGKWVDQTFDFSTDFHVVFGKNEAGKSTMMSFIHSILFGFPTRHSALLRYEPKDSSRYGGKILVEDERFGLVSIERVQGKSTGDVTVLLEDGATGGETLLNTIVYGVDRSLYQSVFSFHLKGIEKVEDMTKEQLNRYFLSAGALGTEQFLQRADMYKQQANKLYKPTGRVPEINQAIKQLEEKQRSMDNTKQKNKEYLDLLQQINLLEQSLAELEKTTVALNKHSQNLKQLDQNYDMIEEITVLEMEIEQLNTSNLSENGLYELASLNKQIEDIRITIRDNQERLKIVEQQYEPSQKLIMYQENEQAIDALAVQMGTMDDLIREQHYSKKEVERLEAERNEKRDRLNLERADSIPKAWTKADKENIQALQQLQEQKEQTYHQLNEKLSTIDFKRSSLDESIDILEADLWSNETFRKEEEYHEARFKNQNKPNNFLIEMIFLGFSIVLLVSLATFDVPFALPLSLVALLVAMGSCWHLWAKIRAQQASSNEHATYETYIQQKEMRRQWRQYLFNSDKLEDEKQTITLAINQVEDDLEVNQTEWETFKQEKLVKQSIALNQAFTFEREVSELIEVGKQLEKAEAQLEEYETKIDLKTAQFDSLSELFEEDDDAIQKIQLFKRFYKEVKEEKNQLQQYMIESREVRQDLNRLIENEKTTLMKKQRLLKNAGADSEEVFRHLHGLLKQKNEKVERLNVLKEQLPENHEIFKTSSKEDLNAQQQQVEQEISDSIKETKQLTQKKIELEVQVKRLEEGGEYTALLQSFENKKSALQELVNQWVTKKLAAHMIEQTLKYARKDRLPQTIIDAEKYFEYLTQGKYSKIVVDDEAIQVLDREGQYFEASELSRGTAEPLYVSLRLAFIKNIQDTIKLPLLIDDGFVNLDWTRRSRMYELLKEISQTTQVLYFSFDEQSLEGAKKSQQTILGK